MDEKLLLKLKGYPVAEYIASDIYLSFRSKISARYKRLGEAASTYHELPVAFKSNFSIDTFTLGNNDLSKDSATNNKTSPKALLSKTGSDFITIA